MATSLAAQLKSVGSLNAARLSSRALQSTSSYLFPAHAAAQQPLSAVQEAAANGWADLCVQDPSLELWAPAEQLFGEASRQVDRTVLDRQQNQRLDELVAEWLVKCGEYLLSKPAAKCLEWLVRRFRINEFSAQQVLAAFIPYHSTPQFSRMLAICKIEDRPHLGFLALYKKRVEPVPASAIVTACLGADTTPALDTLRFVANLMPSAKTGAPDAGEPHRALVAFWTGTLARVCLAWAGHTDETTSGGSKAQRRHSQPRLEQAKRLVGVLLPRATELAASDPASVGLEAQLGGCMLLCAIGSSFPISIEAARATLEAILGGATAWPRLPRASSRALLAACYALVAGADAEWHRLFKYEHDALDDQGVILSPRILDQLLRLPSLHQHLADAAKSHCIDSFLAHLLHALKASRSQHDEIARLLKTGLLPDAIVGLDVAETVRHATSDADEAPRDAAAKHLALLWKHHPAVVDSAVATLSTDEAASLRRRILFSTGSGKHGSIGAEDALWLRLNGPSSAQRRTALETLLDRVASGQVAVGKGAVKEALKARIADDANVLQVLYSERGVKALQAALGASDVLDTMSGLLGAETATASDDGTLALHLRCATHHLLGQTSKAGERFFRQVLWPRLQRLSRPSRDAETKLVEEALLVAASSKNSGEGCARGSTLALVRQLGAALKSVPEGSTDGKVDALSKAFACHLARECSASAVSGSTAWLLAQVKEGLGGSVATATLALCSLEHLLAEIEGGARRYQLANRILSTLAEVPASSRHPASRLLLRIIRALPKGRSSTKGRVRDSYALSKVSAEMRIARRLYELATAPEVAPETSQQLLDSLFSRLGEAAISVLASVWTQGEQAPSVEGLGVSASSSAQKLAALRHARAVVRALASVEAWDFQPILPAALLSLRNPAGALRSGGLDLIEELKLAASSSLRSAEPGTIVFGYDSLYGVEDSQELRYMDLPDLVRLCESICAHRRAIVDDDEAAAVAVGETLCPSRADDKKSRNFKATATTFLVSHILCWNEYGPRQALLSLLSRVSSPLKLKQLIPLLAKLLTERKDRDGVETALDGASPAQQEVLARMLLANFDRSARTLLEQADSTESHLLAKALSDRRAAVNGQALAVASEVTRHVRHDARLCLVLTMLQVCTRGTSYTPAELLAALKSVEIDAALLSAAMTHLRASLAPVVADDLPSKRARQSHPDGRNDAMRVAHDSLCLLVEASLGRALAAVPQLLSQAFELLGVAVDLHGSEAIDTERLMQHTMSLLNQLLQGAEASVGGAAATQILRADIVINAVKLSPNPQTMSQALLLLARMATITPDAVLHNAMSIFTFVGSAMLHRDDDVSFGVVERTVRSIVPALVASFQADLIASGSDPHLALVQRSRMLLCIFTDSAAHIPRHRREAFFVLLVETLGRTEYLSAVAMLLTHRVAHKVAKADTTESATLLQLPLTIIGRFDVQTQLIALAQIWAESVRLHQLRREDALEVQSKIFLDVTSQAHREHSGRASDLNTSARALGQLARAATSSARFLQGLADHDASPSDPAALHGLIAKTLAASQCKDARLAEAAQVCLTQTMSVAPLPAFVTILTSLLAKVEYRAGALALYASRRPKTNEDEEELLATMTPDIIRQSLDILGDAKSTLADRSAALAALRVVAENCVASEQSHLAGAVPALSHLAPTEPAAYGVLVPMTKHLGSFLIARLATLVPLGCTGLAAQAKEIAVGEAVTGYGLFGPAQLLVGIFDALPSFAVNHLDRVLATICDVHVQRSMSKEDPLSVGRLVSTLVKRVPTQRLLDGVVQRFHALQGGAKALAVGLLDVLQRIVRSSDRVTVTRTYKAIFRFLLEVLDLRREAPTHGLNPAQLDAIEERAMSCLVKMVLKLNEGMFRSLFLRLYDWAALDLVDEDGDGDEIADPGLCARRLVFYRALRRLLGVLQGLAAGYYTHVIDLSLELLAALHDGRLDRARHPELYELVLETMRQSAEHDEGSLWNRERLDKALPVVVSCLADEGREGAQLDRICGLVCAVGRTLGDEASVKHINSTLLSKARSASGGVGGGGGGGDSARFAALRASRRLWSSEELRGALLTLVPETVPFVSELLDADDDGVLRETNALVSAIEEVLGEPLDSYLQ